MSAGAGPPSLPTGRSRTAKAPTVRPRRSYQPSDGILQACYSRSKPSPGRNKGCCGDNMGCFGDSMGCLWRSKATLNSGLRALLQSLACKTGVSEVEKTLQGRAPWPAGRAVRSVWGENPCHYFLENCAPRRHRQGRRAECPTRKLRPLAARKAMAGAKKFVKTPLELILFA